MFTIAYLTDLFILWKLHRIFLEATLLLIFIHSIRLVWTEPPRELMSIIIIWFCVNVLIISQWKELPFDDKAKVLFWTMRSLGYTGKSYDLGFATESGVIIYSLRFTLMSDLYFLLVALVLTISYIRVKPPHPTRDIMRAYFYMKLTVFGVLTSSIFAVFWNGNYRSILIGSFLVLAFILMNYVSIEYPEIMLISHAQLMRAMSLYPSVQGIVRGEHNRIEDIPSLIKYIESLPEDITKLR